MLGEWFSGRKPYYPGTAAVLGLKRLPLKLRDELDIHDPREFNTRVVSPAFKRLKETRGPDHAHGLDDVFRQVEDLRRHGVRCITALAHPRELETKGEMRRDHIEPFVVELLERFGLDGLEVNNSRDSAEDSVFWSRLADRLDAGIRSGAVAAHHAMVRLCFSSDFHVLAPGLATGEITLGYGMLDESVGHRRGNLSARIEADELLRLVESEAR